MAKYLGFLAALVAAMAIVAPVANADQPATTLNVTTVATTDNGGGSYVTVSGCGYKGTVEVNLTVPGNSSTLYQVVEADANGCITATFFADSDNPGTYTVRVYDVNNWRLLAGPLEFVL